MIKHLSLASCMILLAVGYNFGENANTEWTARLQTDQTETAKAIADIYAADYVYHGPAGFEMRGLEAVRTFAASILAASGDRHAVVEQQVAEGNLVATRFISRSAPAPTQSSCTRSFQYGRERL